MTTLEHILNSNGVISENGTHFPLDAAIYRNEGEFLQRIIRAKRPSGSLEVGLALGISALFICEALERVGGQKHIIIDPLQCDWDRVGLRNLKDAGYEHLVEYYEMESGVALPRLVDSGIKIDFAFIDGNHTFDHTLVDFFYIDKLLKVGGVVVFDDANWPSVHRMCRYVATNRAYSACGEIGGTGASWKRQTMNWLGGLPVMRRIVQRRFTLPDEKLGFLSDSSMIAFEKKGDDSFSVRRWDFDREF